MSHSSSIPVAVSDFNQLFYGIAVLLLCYGDAPLEEHAVVGRILKIWDAETVAREFVLFWKLFIRAANPVIVYVWSS